MFIEYMRLVCLNGLTVPVKSNLIYARHTKNMEHTIGDITTQLSFICDNNSEQIVSIFSYGIDRTKTSAFLAIERLSVPVIFPLISSYASFAKFKYS